MIRDMNPPSANIRKPNYTHEKCHNSLQLLLHLSTCLWIQMFCILWIFRVCKFLRSMSCKSFNTKVRRQRCIADFAPAPLARRTRLVLAPGTFCDRTQPIPCSRGVSPFTTLQWGCEATQFAVAATNQNRPIGLFRFRAIFRIPRLSCMIFSTEYFDSWTLITQSEIRHFWERLPVNPLRMSRWTEYVTITAFFARRSTAYRWNRTCIKLIGRQYVDSTADRQTDGLGAKRSILRY